MTGISEKDNAFIEDILEVFKDQTLHEARREHIIVEQKRASNVTYGPQTKEHASKNAAIFIAYGLAVLIGAVCVFWILVHSGILYFENFPTDQFDGAVERTLTVLSGFLTFIFGFLFNQKLEAKDG